MTSSRVWKEWELACAHYLAANGFPHAERHGVPGKHDDRGDIDGIPGVILDCKAGAYALGAMGEHLDQVGRARNRAGVDMGIVLAKRRQRGVGDSFFCLPLYQGVKLLKAYCE